MLEASMLFAMLIIWTLIHQMFRYHGIKKYRDANNGNPHPKCRVPADWLTQVRDNTRDIKKNQESILRTMIKIKEMLIKHYGDGN